MSSGGHVGTPRGRARQPKTQSTQRRDVRSRSWSTPKRALDVVLSVLILAVMLPVSAVVALAILLESRGPVLYRAERVGKGGRRFRMLKFRKMHAHAGGLKLTTSDDVRFTRVGGLLARSKLDELPQLLNVLRGEMSLIGPRPEDPGFVERRQADYDVILQVRPGISGFAQIAFADESRILFKEDPLGALPHRNLPAEVRTRPTVRPLDRRRDGYARPPLDRSRDPLQARRRGSPGDRAHGPAPAFPTDGDAGQTRRAAMTASIDELLLRRRSCGRTWAASRSDPRTPRSAGARDGRRRASRSGGPGG